MSIPAIMSALLLALASGSARAEPGAAQLSPAEIRTAFFGTTIIGEYATGEQFREEIGRDGKTIYSDSRETLRPGKAEFQGEMLCFEYVGAGMTGGCFTVQRHGTNCFIYRSTSMDAGWTARGWREGEPPTCRDVPVS